MSWWMERSKFPLQDRWRSNRQEPLDHCASPHPSEKQALQNSDTLGTVPLGTCGDALRCRKPDLRRPQACIPGLQRCPAARERPTQSIHPSSKVLVDEDDHAKLTPLRRGNYRRRLRLDDRTQSMSGHLSAASPCGHPAPSTSSLMRMRTAYESKSSARTPSVVPIPMPIPIPILSLTLPPAAHRHLVRPLNAVHFPSPQLRAAVLYLSCKSCLPPCKPCTAGDEAAPVETGRRASGRGCRHTPGN
ncbi:hypothetical protein DFH06DRAFT_1446587 [Mycena polygramma]|nr:hypothetical protein DFH06DRAFT_1446587 [Mycena polygramma]